VLSGRQIVQPDPGGLVDAFSTAVRV